MEYFRFSKIFKLKLYKDFRTNTREDVKRQEKKKCDFKKVETISQQLYDYFCIILGSSVFFLETCWCRFSVRGWNGEYRWSGMFWGKPVRSFPESADQYRVYNPHKINPSYSWQLQGKILNIFIVCVCHFQHWKVAMLIYGEISFLLSDITHFR